MFNKKKRNKDNRGLSLIEVLIVMAITGMTLIALLNLARRDIVIEKLNEEHDVAGSIALSQMEAMDSIKELNPSCAQNLYNNYSSTKTYFVCQKLDSQGNPFEQGFNSNHSSPITPVNACNGSADQTRNLYSSAADQYIQVVPNDLSSYDCVDTALPSGSQYSTSSAYYQEKITITGTQLNSIGGLSNVESVQVQSHVSTFGIDQRFFDTYQDESYFL